MLASNTIGQNFKDVPKSTASFQTGEEVVEEAFENLGKNPSFISGEYNRQLMGQMFNVEARKQTILAMKQQMQSTMDKYGTGNDHK